MSSVWPFVTSPTKPRLAEAEQATVKLGQCEQGDARAMDRASQRTIGGLLHWLTLITAGHQVSNFALSRVPAFALSIRNALNTNEEVALEKIRQRLCIYDTRQVASHGGQIFCSSGVPA